MISRDGFQVKQRIIESDKYIEPTGQSIPTFYQFIVLRTKLSVLSSDQGWVRPWPNSFFLLLLQTRSLQSYRICLHCVFVFLFCFIRLDSASKCRCWCCSSARVIEVRCSFFPETILPFLHLSNQTQPCHSIHVGTWTTVAAEGLGHLGTLTL